MPTMPDTNGRVAPEHLITRFGVPVSRAIAPLIDATSLAFHRAGHTFSIALPIGGYRDYEQQAGLKANPKAWGSSMASRDIASAGNSTHGYGLAIDVVTNATPAQRAELMAECGWTKAPTNDLNHFTPAGVNPRVAPPASAFASSGSVPIEESENTMIHWGRVDNGVTTYMLGDDEHWEEYTDPARQAHDAALYGVYEDITKVPEKIAAWNYRSNERPDLKKPFGVGAATVQVDTAALATAVAAKLPAGVTVAQITTAVETAVRNVLGSLDGK